MHLEIAERIHQHRSLKGGVRELVESQWPAFYLGSVAADYQAISNIPRDQTHFYQLPPDPEPAPEEQMMIDYPELAEAARLPSGQAVFVAAYRAHLLLDFIWYNQVLTPYFIQSPHWTENRQRFVVHNTLLTYLDKLSLESLPDTAAATLHAAEPQSWLPFAADEELCRWRDMLVVQLRPDAAIRTVEIYAARLGMAPDEFAANLERPEWLDEHLFRKVPLNDIVAILNTAVKRSIDLTVSYLS